MKKLGHREDVVRRAQLGGREAADRKLTAIAERRRVAESGPARSLG